MGKLRKDKRYTYADYILWDGDERYELIDGVPYALASPSTEHQRISGRLYLQFAGYLDGHPCEVFAAPLDVCLFADGEKDDTVVQPDLLVVCDQAKLDEHKCNGAPDMTVEIMSPSTSKRDMQLKRDRYLQAGVREYWIIDPVKKVLIMNVLEDGEYSVNIFTEADAVPVRILEGLTINLPDVFQSE